MDFTYKHIIKRLSSCVRTKVLVCSLLIWGFYGTSIRSLLQTNHISSPCIARKWTIVVSCTRASVYETHQNMHCSTDDSLAVVCPVATEMRWQHPWFTQDVFAENGSQMLMDPHRLHKLIREPLDLLKKKSSTTEVYLMRRSFC